MAAIVSIVRGQRPEEMIKEALDLLGGIENLVSGKNILIKPNLGPWSVGIVPEYVNRWATTKPELVAALVKQLRDAGVEEISVAESGFIGYDATAQFEESGMKEVVEKAGGKIIDLDKGEYEKVKLTEDISAEIGKAVLEADSIINMPILKTHMWTKVSLGIKNMKGVISARAKREFHRKNVEPLLAYLCKAVTPQLIIVDGTLGYEGLGPVLFGKPRKVGIVIAGTDPVAVDAVSSAVMGHDPKEVDHIRIAAELGLGEIELDRIEIRGARMDEVKQSFEPSPLGGHNMVAMLEMGGVRYFGSRPGDTISECSGCIGNIVAALAALRSDTGRLQRPLDIVAGMRDLPEGAGDNLLLYGNCQARNKDKGTHLPGCPPDIKGTYSAIGKITLSRGAYMKALMKRIFKGQKIKPLAHWEEYKNVTPFQA